MSFGVGLGDLALVLKTCIAIYKQFQEADETIENAHDRIQTLYLYVNTVIGSLNDEFGGQHQYPKSEPCRSIILRMDLKAKEVRKIFREYQEIQMQPNYASAKWCQLLYVCGSSTRELQTLITGLERHREDLAHQYVALMLSKKTQQPNGPVIQPKLSPTPSGRKGLNILFLDSDNVGRSVVAQAYAMLVSEWTKRTQNPWRIDTIHSAGIDVVNQGGLAELRQRSSLKMYEGKEQPSSLALSALFDKPVFNHPYKAAIREKINHRVSRGLGRSSFATYDYIIVFTLNHLWGVKKLLLETKKKSPSLVVRGKSKFVVLGEYGSSQTDSNIWGPKKGQSEYAKREYWNRTVANIKVSFKGWLTEELDWKQPTKATPRD